MPNVLRNLYKSGTYLLWAKEADMFDTILLFLYYKLTELIIYIYNAKEKGRAKLKSFPLVKTSHNWTLSTYKMLV